MGVQLASFAGFLFFRHHHVILEMGGLTLPKHGALIYWVSVSPLSTTLTNRFSVIL